ncbi:sigma-70 family RNA polymerase sigma factor [Ureibacillus sp. Re31]|uniref:Sigma-70 family RNA polymerase sigma factor n=1 Tax=Ureibacillus galli TaxID=2762222 RepID=A0ABR8XFD3_9BACL|nr:sigma-70 family RNA polymerase sigma factor [Ureibacillus galli]MBD8027943.1 sigma-70 family RNA polymerase sigma factor [Ureibacillus galli]
MEQIELAKKAIAGDETALLQLLKQEESTHYRIAFSYLKNEHDSLEAIQEFTFRCFRKIHTVKQAQFLNTWLIRVLLNVCNDIQKKKSRYEFRKDVEELTFQVDSNKLELSEAISKLSPEQQQLIYLKYYCDLKNKEIAKEIHISEGTVKSRLHTALKKLRLLFNEGGQS